MFHTLKSLARRLQSLPVRNPAAVRRARFRPGFEPLEDRALMTVGWAEVRAALAAGQELMKNVHVRQLIDQATDALRADIPVVNQSPAGAADVLGKLQGVFEDAQAGVTETIDAARVALTNAGFTVERLEVTPEAGTSDFVRLRYSPAPVTAATTLSVGTTLDLGEYFDRSYGTIAIGTTTGSVTLGMDVVYGVDLQNGVPSFYVSDRTGVRVTDLRLTTPLDARLTIGSLADVAAHGTLTVDVDAALEIADRPGGKVRLDELAGAATGTLGGSVSLAGATFKANVPIIDSITWTGSFGVDLGTGAFTGGVNLPSAEQAIGWIADAAGKFVSGIGNIPFLGEIGGLLGTDVGSIGDLGNLGGFGSLGDGIDLTAGLGWLLSPQWASPGGSGLGLLTSVGQQLQGLGITLLPQYAPGGITLAEVGDIVGKLVNGRPVDLIRYETGGGDEWGDPISVTLATAAFAVGPIPVTAQVKAFVQPHVGWSYHVGLGVDTTGMYVTQNTGVRVFGGVRAGVEAVAKVAGIFGLSVQAGAGLSVQAGVGFNDPNPTDGRIYLDELFGAAAPAGAGFLDVIRFNAGAEANGFVKVQVETPWPLPNVTLLDETFATQAVYDPTAESRTITSKRTRNLMTDGRYTPVVHVVNGQRVLVLEGTELSDGFRLSGTGGTVRVNKFGTGEGTATGIDRVEFRGHGGADQLLVDSTFDRPIWADGGAGNDVIEGGAAADTLLGGNEVDPLSKEGFDRLFGRGGADVLDGGDKADELDGGAGADTLYGGGGGDRLVGGEDDDRLDGGAGDDALDGGTGDDTLLGGAGQDDLAGGSGNDWLDGGANDTVVVAGTPRLLGDVLDGGSGHDTLLGGAGTDLLIGGTGHDDLRGDGDDDRLMGGEGDDTLAGGDGHDVLSGDAGDDSLSGGGGNDYLSGGADSDTGRGGTGDDTLRGGAGYDELFGEDDQDRFELDFLSDADGITDRLDGGNHRDFLAVVPVVTDRNGDNEQDESGNDHIVLTQQPGTTHFTATWRERGAAGSLDGARTITFDLLPETADVVVVSGLGGHDLIEVAEAVTAPVRAEGGAGHDTVRGGSGNDTLVGGTGNDVLSGRGGRDVLQGGEDADTLDGGADADAVYGDGGNDTVLGGAGRDVLGGGAGDDRLEAADDLLGDLMYGDGGNDTLVGGTGLDVMEGGGDNDYLDGGGQTDYLRGGDGDDTLLGGAGRDQLTGGAGRDELRAGDDPAPGVADWKALDRAMDEEAAYLRDVVIEALDQELAAPGLPPEHLAQLEAERQRAGDTRAAIRLTQAGLDPEQSVFVDVLDGGAGDDTLHGSWWNDLIQGGADSDTVVHTTGRDSVFGGTGGDAEDDTYVMHGTPASDVIWLAYNPVVGSLSAQVQSPGAENPEVVTVGGIEFESVEVDGGAGDDLMTLAPLGSWVPVDESVKLTGGAGNDTLEAGTYTGDTVLDGGADHDTMSGGTARNTLLGGAGNDTLTGGGSGDMLDGGADDDTLLGGAGDDTLVAAAGDGADVLDGGADQDTFAGWGTAFLTDTVIGGAGTDTIHNTDGMAVPLTLTAFGPGWQVERIDGADQPVHGTEGSDALDFTTVVWVGVPFVDALGGDDVVRGTAGADDLRGGAGTDVLDGGAGNDILAGGVGNDTLYGWGGNDVLGGGDGNDVLWGGENGDTLRGGAGNDQLFGEAGNDSLYGFDGGTGLATVDLLLIEFAGGNDTLWGGVGNDLLYGSAGVDLLIGEAGRDTLNAGAGNDSLHGDFHQADAGSGADVDYIQGGAGDDWIWGGGGNDAIDTGSGNNRAYGGDGNDTLDGQSGRDTLYGGNGNDLIRGRGENDQIDGQLGSDTLYGGAGNDTLVPGGNSDGVPDYLYGEDGVDTLYYFRGQDEARGDAEIDRYIMQWWDAGVLKTQTWYDGYYYYNGTYTQYPLFFFGVYQVYL